MINKKTRRLKTLIDKVVEKRVLTVLAENGIYTLTEAFESPKLTKLAAILKKSDAEYNDGSSKIFHALASQFGIEASKIPDSKVRVMEPHKSIFQYTKKNPNVYAIFVNEKEGRVIGAVADGGWASIRGYTQGHWNRSYGEWANEKDPKHIRNKPNNAKYGYTSSGERRSNDMKFGKQAGTKSGRGGYGNRNYGSPALNRDDLVTQSDKVYVIDFNASEDVKQATGDKLQSRRNDARYISKTFNMFRNEWKEKVKEYLKVKRTNKELPEDLQARAKQIDAISSEVLGVVNTIIQNPAKFSSYNVYKDEYWGQGSSQRSTKYGLMEIYINITEAFQKAVNAFKSGGDYTGDYSFRNLDNEIKKLNTIFASIKRAMER